MITDPDTLLDSYNSNMLWDMARAGRISGAGGTKPKKADLIQLMRQEFFKPERIKASYQRLSERERDILDRLLLRSGQTSTRLFKRELLRAELVTEAPPYESPKKEKSWYASRGHQFTAELSTISPTLLKQSPPYLKMS